MKLGSKIDIQKQTLQESFGKMEEIEKLKKTLATLKGHRTRQRSRFDKNLQYSDIRRTEQLKIALLEQNDKVISHLEKMGNVGQDESLQVAVSKELEEARAIDEDVSETFACISKESMKSQPKVIKGTEQIIMRKNRNKSG